MLIRNQEIQEIHKFFFDAEQHQILTLQDCSQRAINNAIYFSPNSWPFVNRRRTDQGSCFQGLEVFTGSWEFDLSHAAPVPRLRDKSTELDVYRRMIADHIYQSMVALYENHKEINIFFSGGIDSLVCLAHVMALGVADRTRIHIMRNHIQVSNSALSRNGELRQLVEQLISESDQNWLDVIWHDIYLRDLADAFNLGDHSALRCYSTWAVACKYRDQVWINGGHGNYSLLHHRDLLDELVLRNPDAGRAMSKLIKEQCYTREIVSRGVDTPLTPIEFRSFSEKPWHLLNGRQGHEFHAPLADNQIFDRLRTLDFSSIDVSVLAQVSLGREILHKVLKGQWDQFVKYESDEDGDNIPANISIPLDWLDCTQLRTDQHLKHAQQGVDYIQYNLSNAHTTKHVDFNVLCSIKMLDNMEKIYLGNSKTDF